MVHNRIVFFRTQTKKREEENFVGKMLRVNRRRKKAA